MNQRNKPSLTLMASLLTAALLCTGITLAGPRPRPQTRAAKPKACVPTVESLGISIDINATLKAEFRQSCAPYGAGPPCKFFYLASLWKWSDATHTYERFGSVDCLPRSQACGTSSLYYTYIFNTRNMFVGDYLYNVSVYSGADCQHLGPMLGLQWLYFSV